MSVDQADRDRAIRARRANLLVDAGAGTGKTTLIVARLLEMLAPADDGEAWPLERIVAVTFTRRAAGELRLRVRAELLRHLASSSLSSTRRGRFEVALGTLDAAFIGTIHSFADRLLRLYPVEAGVSPSYVIDDDATDIMRATYGSMLEMAQNGTLAAELAGTGLEALAEEATSTLLDALAAGIRSISEELEFMTRPGLDLLVQRLLENRDVAPRDLPPASFDNEAFAAAKLPIQLLIGKLQGVDRGEAWMRRFGRELARGVEPHQLGAILAMAHAGRKDIIQKNFSDKAGKASWKQFDETLADELLAPIRSWFAHRLVRIMPVAEALYERAKATKGSVDSIDLLLKLRNVLTRDKVVRGRLQRLFDHIFIDEFQDTDPLQAEIVMFLCEVSPLAERWNDVVLSEGKITLVGDPKQSIYRFRRADVALYDAVRAKIASQPHEAVRLSANFRSVPALIAWQNRAFGPLLGVGAEGQGPFDATTGTVFHQPLLPGREAESKAAVHVLPFEHADSEPSNVDAARTLEAEATAHYLQWLFGENSGVTIQDPTTRTSRRVRPGDVAVLAVVTSSVPLLLRALDRVGISYAASGGRLFLSDPIHRQFVLGLRALADRDDGVATLALMQPPFFALDLQALVDAKEGDDSKVAPARAWIAETRRRRFERAPALTARALLEETGFGRTIAIGPNGAQRLAMLEELCLQLELIATHERVDFDGATARLLEWVKDPIGLDPPRPVASEAIQVMTVHQSKGLEFPVVVLWDGMGNLRSPTSNTVFAVDRTSARWSLELSGGLCWEEPTGGTLLEREQKFADAERRRLVYVAATRARDLFVLPRPKVKNGKDYRNELLITSGGTEHVTVMEPWREDRGASWSNIVRASARPLVDTDVDVRALARWKTAEAVARRAWARPVGISALSHQRELEEADVDGVEARTPQKLRPGRFGPVFGTTIHLAIAMVVEQRRSAMDAVKRAARATTLDGSLHDAAAADVDRAVFALREAGLLDAALVRRFEYPVAGAVVVGDGQILASGYIDLVVATDPLTVIDFKTDRAPADLAEVPEYAEQVTTYARILRPADSAVRKGLLFTETGSIVWAAAG